MLFAPDRRPDLLLRNIRTLGASRDVASRLGHLTYFFFSLNVVLLG